MSTLVAEQAQSTVESSTQRTDAITRTAMYITSGGRPLLAWLHSARDRASVDHGVVICPPVGFEQLHSHRSVRHLADAIALSGIPVVRFDWHGTGDSAGSDEDPSRRITWHANVRDVVAWMRSHLGCRRMSVVGLRMGALLAVEALGEHDCDNLVLWAPVTCGKAYLRQMQSIEKMTELRPCPAYAKPGDVEAAGFVISEETVEQFSEINLLQRQIHCLRGLLVGPFDKRLVERFAQFDIPVDQHTSPGFAEMMAEPHLGKVPRQTIAEIADWLGNRILNSWPSPLQPEHASLGLREATLHETTLGERAASTQADPPLRERILRIGGAVNLFGIMTEPAEPSNQRPTIVMLNAGSASHVGPGRVNVDLARRLARQGYRCVRLDACGLGDSVAPNPAEENHPYPVTVFRDVELTLEELYTRFGVDRCVLMGLCSGAYAAFQSAAQLTHPSLIASILINPLTFHWQDDMSFDAPVADSALREHFYMARPFNPRNIWKFLLGRSEISYTGALRLLLRRIAHSWKSNALEVPRVGDLSPPDVAAHPTEENLPRDLARVVAAKRQLAMFLAENDPGYAIMTYYARNQVRQMRKAGQLHLETVSCADHTFSRRVPRDKLARALLQYLQRRYP